MTEMARSKTAKAVHDKGNLSAFLFRISQEPRRAWERSQV